MKRSSGVLMPVFALGGRYGIGNLGKEACDFVDFLSEAGQSFWQVLPVGPTSYGDSPYQGPSAFAGNPYFIDPDVLKDQGLLTSEECEKESAGCDTDRIDYGGLYKRRLSLLRKAYRRYDDTAALRTFKRTHSWVRSYALFMSIKDSLGGIPWTRWPVSLRKHESRALSDYEKKLRDETDLYIFIQLKFFEQWLKLKKYANSRGIRIIGDIPIYVALDSADVWENQDMYRLYKNGRPRVVAGTPPDYFSETGQLWGNPIYNWKKMKEDGYSWWKERIRASFGLYDCLRIDHFRGFESYYAVPGKDETAKNGRWEKGPGKDFIDILKTTVKNADVIAEDLGFLTPRVTELLNYSGYPGMKVLEFAFDGGSDNPYLPHNYPENCIVYTGTHDNQTIRGWFGSADKKTLDFAAKYLGIPKEYIEKAFFKGDQQDKKSPSGQRELARFCTRAMIRAGFVSKAQRVIIPLQDWLCLDDTARINTPSTLGANWCWRIKKGSLTPELSREMREITRIYGRL